LKELTTLIQEYYSNIESPRKTAKAMFHTLKNRLQDSTYSSYSNSDEEVITKKKKYTPKPYKCEACNITMSIKNKVNHERTYKHQRMLAAQQAEDIEEYE